MCLRDSCFGDSYVPGHQLRHRAGQHKLIGGQGYTRPR